jgi:hypothetical protein
MASSARTRGLKGDRGPCAWYAAVCVHAGSTAPCSMFADCELVSVAPRCAAPPVCVDDAYGAGDPQDGGRAAGAQRRAPHRYPGHVFGSFPRSECCACKGGAVALSKPRQILQTSTGGEYPACATCACAQAAECVHDGGRMASWASVGAIRCDLFCRPR